MKFTAVGDIILGRRIQEGYKGYEELAPIIKQGDARFFNLETTLNREGECYASEFSGGTWLRTNPEVLDDIKKFGFNMLTFNNNHAMDYGMDGFLSTLEAVEKSGLVHAGAGRNLGEAAAPRYLDTAAGRVALISFNSSLSGPMSAGKQTPRMKGRPGVNALNYDSYVELEASEFDQIQAIIRKTGINAEMEMDKRDGYYGGVDDSYEMIGGMKFVRGDRTQWVKKCKKETLDRVEKAIYEAKLQADYIMVTVHSHMMGEDRFSSPDFFKEFCHYCIDAGAHAVVGHGPHLLRPIEIYKGKPIFYSLGDFAIELYNVAIAPEDFYAQYGLTSDATVHELLKTRSKDFTIGLMTKPVMFQTVIPYWETDDEGNLLSMTLYPVVAPMDGKKCDIGLPRLATDLSYMDDFLARCARHGTRFQKNEDGTFRLV
ncbi:MAG: CapA family protein [Clostridia bacterium]|nr:CapA family protein [Clostridia bacterium]